MKVEVIRSLDAMYDSTVIRDYKKRIFNGIYSFKYDTMRCRYCEKKTTIFALDLCTDCLYLRYGIDV